MLTELKIQFDLVTEFVSWDRYKLLIFPDDVTFTPSMTERVSKHLKQGGKILATSRSGLDLHEVHRAAFRSRLPSAEPVLKSRFKTIQRKNHDRFSFSAAVFPRIQDLSVSAVKKGFSPCPLAETCFCLKYLKKASGKCRILCYSMHLNSRN